MLTVINSLPIVGGPLQLESQGNVVSKSIFRAGAALHWLCAQTGWLNNFLFSNLQPDTFSGRGEEKSLRALVEANWRGQSYL